MFSSLFGSGATSRLLISRVKSGAGCGVWRGVWCVFGVVCGVMSMVW